MGVSFSGIVSGLDTNNIVRQLVSLERGTVRRIEGKKSDAQKSLAAYGDLNKKLSSLRDTVKEMADSEKFGKLTSTTTNDKVLTASAEGSAAEGTYEVVVQQLAKNSKVMSDSFSSKTSTGLFGTGTLSLTVDGEATEFTVDETTTLSTLKDAINAAGKDFVASIVNDGNGFRLFVQGKQTGAENAVTLTESEGLSLNLDAQGNTLSTAQDAQIQIDGALTVTSSSNTFTDVLEGVTFNALKVDADPVTLEIKRDTDSQIEAFKSFLDGYNDVAKFIHQKIRPATIGARSDLINDPTMRAVQGQLSTLLQTSVQNNSEFTSLSQIGFETKQDGTLKLDEGDLKKALAKDFQGVLSIFTKDTDGLADKYDTALKNLTDTDGLIDSRKDSLNDRIKGLNKSIDRQNARVDAYEARLKAQFLAMETAIQKLNTQSSSLNGQLGIYQQ